MENIIIIIGCFIVFIAILYIYYKYNEYKLFIKGLSFKESIDLTNLPIITMVCGEQKFNFLLDTGSDNSHINKELVDNGKIKVEPCNKVSYVYGYNSAEVEVKHCYITLGYKNNVFTSEFLLSDLKTAFDTIKQETGVTIHGILGSKFFYKYKYILDFNDCRFYKK